jgi:hypothetical protein
MKNIAIVVTLLVTLSSCYKRGYIQLNSLDNEQIASNAIKTFLAKNSSPSIVLKAPKSGRKSTTSDRNTYIYNAIEKELLVAGFNVKDRGLFNAVMEKSKEVNYKDIKELTNTDLLLELVQVSRKVKFKTNKVQTKKGEEKVLKNSDFTLYGAVIEFKLTIIETNQFAGSYTFYWSPCTNLDYSCDCEVVYNLTATKTYPHLSFCGEDKNNTGYEYVSESHMASIARDGVKRMIAEMK